MIRVMHIISDTNIGGAGKWVITYCQNRNKDKFDILVVIPRDSKLKPELVASGVNVIEIDGLKDKSLDILAISKLEKIIKKYRPNIVHTHASLSARIAARKCKDVKVIYTKHCVFPPSKIYNNKLIRDMNGSFNRKFADKIIATADVAKRDLIKQGNNEEDISIVYNATNGFRKYTDEKIYEIKNKYNIEPNDTVICMLARIEELKGYKYYIQSAKQILEEMGSRFKFLVVGTGSYENELKALVDHLGIKDNVIFTGFVTNVEEILNIVDIQVNASYISETTNIALLEGMSLGIPTVATDCGGTSKVIRTGINGILVKSQSPDEITKGIKWLLEDKSRFLELQEKSKEIFRAEYMADKFAQSIEKIYEGMVNTK